MITTMVLALMRILQEFQRVVLNTAAQRFVFPNSVYWNGSKYVDNKDILVQDGNYGFWSQDRNTQIAPTIFPVLPPGD